MYVSAFSGMTMDNGVYSNQDYDINIDGFFSPGEEQSLGSYPLRHFFFKDINFRYMIAKPQNIIYIPNTLEMNKNYSEHAHRETIMHIQKSWSIE